MRVIDGMARGLHGQFVAAWFFDNNGSELDKTLLPKASQEARKVVAFLFNMSTAFASGFAIGFVEGIVVNSRCITLISGCLLGISLLARTVFERSLFLKAVVEQDFSVGGLGLGKVFYKNIPEHELTTSFEFRPVRKMHITLFWIHSDAIVASVIH